MACLPDEVVEQIPVRAMVAHGSTSSQAVHPSTRITVLASVRACEDEELFVDYAASGSGIPDWYIPVPFGPGKVVGR